MYFTPLRKHQEEWFSFVVWASLIGTVSAIIGVVIAVWMYSPGKRYRHASAPTSIPYRGWKRWHTTWIGGGQRPLPVVYARMNDAVGTRYYIDPKTARVVGTYSQRGWVNRWLERGLHSLDFPWLYKYRPLWDIVVITLMLGGTALCVTSIILTWRVLSRKVASIVRAKLGTPSEDLVLEVER